MDELSELTRLIENIAAISGGVGTTFIAVLIFAMYSFLRNSNRSLHANLDVMDRFSKWADDQAKRRNDTQTSLDEISNRLLKTSVDFERLKAHHDTEITAYKERMTVLQDSITEYNNRVTMHHNDLKEALREAHDRERTMNEQIQALISQNAILATQNTELVNQIKVLEAEHSKRLEYQQRVIDDLQKQLQAKQAEQARLEIQTARTIARLETQMRMLDRMDNRTGAMNNDITTSTEKQAPMDSESHGNS